MTFMNDATFDKLKKLAKEEFGVEISRGENKSSFKKLFGVDEESAKKIGRDACIEKLGYEFVKQHKENTVFACGLHDEEMFCFVGVNNEEFVSAKTENLVLDSTSQWQYRVSCFVSLKNGAVRFKECIVPEKNNK